MVQRTGTMHVPSAVTATSLNGQMRQLEVLTPLGGKARNATHSGDVLYGTKTLRPEELSTILQLPVAPKVLMVA